MPERVWRFKSSPQQKGPSPLDADNTSIDDRSSLPYTTRGQGMESPSPTAAAWGEASLAAHLFGFSRPVRDCGELFPCPLRASWKERK